MPQINKALAENSPTNLDRRFDHALEETFPTSDSVSVVITKGGAIDYDEYGEAVSELPTPSGQEAQHPSERPSKESNDTLRAGADPMTATAHAASDRSVNNTRDAAHERSEAERKVREGARAAPNQAARNPLIMLVAGVGLGYALSWMIHADRSTSKERRPDRTRARRMSPRRLGNGNTQTERDMGSA
jgi:hypothetical protein